MEKKINSYMSEDLQEKLEQAFKDYQETQKEKNIREHGCQLSNTLYDENKILKKYNKLQEKEIKILEKDLVESRKNRKWETVLAWVFTGGVVGIFGMCLTSMIYIIRK